MAKFSSQLKQTIQTRTQRKVQEQQETRKQVSEQEYQQEIAKQNAITKAQEKLENAKQKGDYSIMLEAVEDLKFALKNADSQKYSKEIENLSEYKSEIKEQQEWQKVQKIVDRDKPPFFLTPSEQKKYQILKEEQRGAKAKAKAWESLRGLEKTYEVSIKPLSSWKEFEVKKAGVTTVVKAENLGEAISGNIDYTLNLGKKETTPEDKSVISAGFNKFTETEQEENIYLINKAKILGIGNWIKKTLGIDTTAKTPEIKWETTKTASQGLQGTTSIIETKLTPSSQNYVNFLMKADVLSNKRFEEYKENIESISVGQRTQSQIDVFKAEQEKKFDEGIKNLQTSYTEQESKFEKEKTLKSLEPYGLVNVGKRYYQITEWEEKRKAPIWETEEKIQQKTKDLYYSQRTGKIKLPPIVATATSETAEFIFAGLPYGVYKAVYEHPVTIPAKAVAVAGIIAGAGVIATHSAGAGTLASSEAIKVAGKILTGVYIGSVAVRTAIPETSFKKGEKLGEIGAEEVAPLLVGGYVGAKSIGKVNALIDKITYKWSGKYAFRSPYKLTRMELLREEEKFPTISPHGKSAQLRAFEKQRENVLADELIRIKKGEIIYAGSHATGSRSAFMKGQTVISSEGREIGGMSVSADDLSINFLRIRQSPSVSLYSGSGFPVGSSPLGLRIELQGYGKIPSNYKPILTRAELQEILGSKINPTYFKETAWLYEKGFFGKGYVAGLKPEVEAYLKGGGILEKTTRPIVYTSIEKASFYKKLEEVTRKGYTEYLNRVKKFSITKPDTWLDKITPRLNKQGNLVFGRKAGQIKPINVGRVVPIGRYEALGSEAKGSLITAKIKELMEKGTKRTDIVQVLKKMEKQMSSSSAYPSSLSASYPISYGSMISFSSPSKSKISYSKSYGYSVPSSVIASSSPSIPSSIVSGSYAYSSGYSKPSKPSYPSYPKIPTESPPYVPKIDFGIFGLKQKIRKKRRKYPEIKGVLPDFTTIALGLKPEEFELKNMKKINKAMSRIQTGFEIRTGARIKGLTNKQERVMMRGLIQ